MIRKMTFFAALLTLAAAPCFLALTGEPVKPAEPAEGQEAEAPEKSKEDLLRGASAIAELEVTPEAARAITKALDFIAAQQQRDGSFAANGGQHRAAMTGLAGLALLAGGHTPGRGKHARVVEKAIRFLIKLQRADREGCFGDAGGRSMHGHGYALHFMAEAYGMTSDPELSRELRKSVRDGVRLTCRCQSPEGGWYYQPVARGHEGSITVTQVQALWAARQAGITVPQRNIDKGIKYMKDSQKKNADGGISYRLGQPGSRPALSVAGVMVFCGLGQRESAEARKAIGYMRKMLSGKVRNYRRVSSFDAYTTLYLGQALYQAGDPDWSQHYPKLRDELIKQQKTDGSWGQTAYGGVYSASCFTLVLAIPYQYLPTFQR